MEEVEYVLNKLLLVIARLRDLSPVWREMKAA
jgi:hypothetical protein